MTAANATIRSGNVDAPAARERSGADTTEVAVMQPQGTSQRVCPECEQDFVPKKVGQRYCSKICVSRSAALQSVPDRLWSKVNKGAPHGCWEWTGTTARGYGYMSVDGKPRPVHRIAYELVIGPIPVNRVLDHLCRNRRCCNPDHLEPVTEAENILRGVGSSARHARKTHCDHGHPLSGDNLRLTDKGYRRCRQCARDAQARSNRPSQAGGKGTRWVYIAMHPNNYPLAVYRNKTAAEIHADEEAGVFIVQLELLSGFVPRDEAV